MGRHGLSTVSHNTAHLYEWLDDLTTVQYSFTKLQQGRSYGKEEPVRKPQHHVHTLKFYLPLRNPNLRILTPLEKVVAGLESGKMGSPLEIRTFLGKGRGVVASKKIPCGAFVTEYKTKEVYGTK